MKKTQVVNLGKVKDLLAEWEKVRRHILAGDLTGFHTAFSDTQGRETIFFGGVYKDDPAVAVRAALKISAARTMKEDDPPMFQASNL